MTHHPKSLPRLIISSCRSFIVGTVAVLLLIVLAFVLSAPQGNAFATSLSGETTNSASTTAGYPIKVYFSKFPDSANDFGAVFPVDRTSPTIAVGTFAIQLLIAGPTLSERSQGYFSELNSILTGPSNCSAPFPTGGPDFTLTLDKRGTVTQTGTATLKFCRSTASPGIGADARVTAEINATLKQFPRIKQVVILTKDGHCFGDLSGKDLCLN